MQKPKHFFDEIEYNNNRKVARKKKGSLQNAKRMGVANGAVERGVGYTIFLSNSQSLKDSLLIIREKMGEKKESGNSNFINEKSSDLPKCGRGTRTHAHTHAPLVRG